MRTLEREAAAPLTNPSLRGAYPTDLLERGATALLLFGAGLYGANDGAWFADRGLTATVVDVDRAKLEAMSRVYPDDWRFVEGDAFGWVSLEPQFFDVVSVDPPTNLSARCLALLPVWLACTRRALVLGLQYETLERARLYLDEPLALRLLRRSRESLWMVLERI